MERMLTMFDACEASTAYIRLPQDAAAFGALRDRLQQTAPGHYLELEELVNAYSSAATLEGFVNGWAWAQATARECLALRELPLLKEDYGPAQRCGSCKWFVQHYRYTGSYPWYSPVGCGHCMCPALEKKEKERRNPLWRGCSQWKD